MTELSTVAARRKLRPRKEPYWHRLSRGVFLGFSAQHDTWHLRVRGADGRQTYQPLGAFDTGQPGQWFDLAKSGAEKHVGPIKNGASDGYTVGQAIADYMAHKHAAVFEKKGEAAAAKAKKDTTSKLAHVTDAERALKVSGLSVSWLETWQRRLYTRDNAPMQPQSAKRVRAVLVAALNEAWRTGKVADAPWKRARTIQVDTVARDYFPTQKEVAELLKNATPDLRDWLDVLRLTGCRPGEASAFKVGDYVKANATLTVTGGKTGKRTIYLNDAGVRLLNRLTKGKAGSDYLCTRADGLPWVNGIEHRPFAEARDKAKLPAEFVPYSLRHFHVSQALLAGVQMQALAENVGTSLLMIQKHYGKFLPSDRRAMLSKVKL